MTTPQLAPYLSLDEAASYISKELGTSWTVSDLIGYAYRNEISICARISTGTKLVRVVPIKGEENNIIAEAGSLTFISAKSCRALLLTGQAEFTEITYPSSVNLAGKLTETMVTVWKLAEGEIAPTFGIVDCKVSSDGVLQLISKQTAIKDLPFNKSNETPIKGMCKLDIAKAFDGIKWSYDEWRNNLANIPKWLEPSLVSRGSKKSHVSHSWNPVIIALSLMDPPRNISIKRLDVVFLGLKKWNEEWQEKTELFR